MMTKEDIINLIEEEDVEFIRLQFTDMLGNLKNMAVTPGQMNRVLNNMYTFDSSAVFGGEYDYPKEVFLVPDLDSFVILPWRPQQGKVGKLICDLAFEDGSLCEYSPRTVLKKVVDEAKKEGYVFMVNPECEFFLFHADENGLPTTVTHEKAGYMDVGPIDFGENARRDIVLNLEKMGFDIESSHHEKAPAQHEIDFTQAESITMADSVTSFKFAVRSIAKRFGLCATFMPKPKSNCAGSGMHLNFALYKKGKNLFELDKNGELSLETQYFIGGILAHAKGMCAITNPIVNSYKRILSGFDAPRKINWSKSGESTAVKFHKSFGEPKVEVRFPDTAANPYLAFAVCIAAGLDGIKNKILPGEENAANPGKLPGNLNDALRAMVADDVIVNVLGTDFVKMYEKLKKNEWNEYMSQVSDWELERYLMRI